MIEGSGEICAWQGNAVRLDFAEHWTPAVPCGFIVVRVKGQGMVESELNASRRRRRRRQGRWL